METLKNKKRVKELETKASFYMNELAYLLPIHNSEKRQAREFVSKLTYIIEELEQVGGRASLIDSAMCCLSSSLSKFA